MRNLLLAAAVLFASSLSALAAKTCTCKCVVKENGKYSTQEATGKDREQAGEKLKKALDKNTCELTPTCTGKCDSDKE
jgi:hypothetical protein